VSFLSLEPPAVASLGGRGGRVARCLLWDAAEGASPGGAPCLLWDAALPRRPVRAQGAPPHRAPVPLPPKPIAKKVSELTALLPPPPPGVDFLPLAFPSGDA